MPRGARRMMGAPILMGDYVNREFYDPSFLLTFSSLQKRHKGIKQGKNGATLSCKGEAGPEKKWPDVENAKK